MGGSEDSLLKLFTQFHLQFPGCLFRERDGNNLFKVRLPFPNQVQDAADKDGGLTCPSSGFNDVAF
jgi:hypothetical protein